MTSIYQGRTKTTVAAVYLSLKGRVREAARGISINDLKKDDGVGEIIRILDEIFQCNETTRAYHAFKDYAEYRRSSDQNFSSLVVEYEKRYREVKRYRLDLPTGVQAFFLLQAANLTPDLEKLARTAATLVYGDMRVIHVAQTVAVCQLKKKTVTTQIEKVITRKVAVTRKGIILENQKVNQEKIQCFQMEIL